MSSADEEWGETIQFGTNILLFVGSHSRSTRADDERFSPNTHSLTPASPPSAAARIHTHTLDVQHTPDGINSGYIAPYALDCPTTGQASGQRLRCRRAGHPAAGTPAVDTNKQGIGVICRSGRRPEVRARGAGRSAAAGGEVRERAHRDVAELATVVALRAAATTLRAFPVLVNRLRAVPGQVSAADDKGTSLESWPRASRALPVGRRSARHWR